MKKILIALFIAMAFSKAYGMEVAQKRTNSETSKAISPLNRRNLIKGFAGLTGAGICAYFTYLAFTHSSKKYSKLRQSKLITYQKQIDSRYNETIKEITSKMHMPKYVVAMFPAYGTYLFGKYAIKQFESIFDKPITS